MKVNNDLKERIKVGALFIFQSYKVIMGSLLTLFVPQECPESETNICSLHDNINKYDDTFHNVALGFNILCVALFFGTYYVELKRENWCVEHLDINPEFPDNHLDDIIDTKPQLKLELRKHNSRYFKSILLTSSVYSVNLLLSSIVIYNNYVGIQAVTSYLSYVALILLKIYNSLSVSYDSLKNEKALSGYITEFSSFNVFDQDIINDTVEENNNEEVSPEDVNLENP